MRLRIGDYDVDVKARNRVGKGNTVFNDNDTFTFLSRVAYVFVVASEYCGEHDLLALQEEYTNQFADIYAVLDDIGYYDDVKED